MKLKCINAKLLFLSPFCCVTFSLFSFLIQRQEDMKNVVIICIIQRICVSACTVHVRNLCTKASWILSTRLHYYNDANGNLHWIFIEDFSYCCDWNQRKGTPHIYAIKYKEINQEKSKSTRFRNSMGTVVKICSKAESASQIPLWIEVLKYLHEFFFLSCILLSETNSNIDKIETKIQNV